MNQVNRSVSIPAASNLLFVEGYVCRMPSFLEQTNSQNGIDCQIKADKVDKVEFPVFFPCCSCIAISIAMNSKYYCFMSNAA